jgi:SAM-dependent methyltransferase
VSVTKPRQTELSTEQLAADLLVDPDVYLPNLQAVMQRVGWTAEADRFMEAVRCTYQTVKAIDHGIDTLANFRRRKHLQPPFRKAMQAASGCLGASLSVLVIGCGSGFVGNSHQFAHDLVQEALPPEQISRIVCHDLVADDLGNGVTIGNLQGQFDLLVTHSLLHFLPNPATFFAAVLPLLNPTAGYCMGHEPNARFWSNPECVRSYQEFCRSGKPERSRWSARVARACRKLRRRSSPSGRNLFADINRVLRRKYQFTDDLSGREISRIVDVHRHCAAAGNFTIGWDGFQTEQLQDRYLPDWEIRWQQTSDYLGHADPASFSPQWQDADRRLRRQFPDDGSSFSVFWFRNTTA